MGVLRSGRPYTLYIAQGMGTPGRPIPGPEGAIELEGFIERVTLSDIPQTPENCVMSTLQAWLEAFVRDQGGVAGTVHLRGPEHLELRAQVNIPEKVQAVTRHIPRGKGMAGLAWARDQPVTTCDLQADDTGDVRPGAKAVQASAAVALPIYESDGTFRGVVGIAFADERDFTPDDLATLRDLAGGLWGA